MASPARKIQIGEFAKLAGTNLRTLRYYEELGLIDPAPRDVGDFRFYEHGQLERIAAIKRLQDLGLSLKEISAAMSTADQSRCAEVVDRLRPALDRQILLTEQKVVKLQTELEELQLARQRVQHMCKDCDQALALDICDPCPRDQQPMPRVLKALLS